MQGIQSLMPGQAPQQLPGMMPQQSSSTPSAEIARYNGLSLPQLTALFQRQPSGVLLRKITDALEVEKTRKAQEGQNAMAAAAQQTGTVKDDVMAAAAAAQRPVMAAQGGIMQGYAGGGAVAFQDGGRTLGFAPDYQLARKYGINLSPYDSPAVREEKISRARAMAKFDEQRQSFGQIPTEAGEALKRETELAYADTSPQRDVAPTPTRMQDTRGITPATVAAARNLGIGQSQQRQQRQEAAQAAPTQAATTQAQGLQNLVDLDKSREEELKVIQGRQAVDPAVAAARKAEREGAEGIASGRQTRAQSRMEEAQRLRDEAVQRAKGDIFSDPEALFRIAAGIDTRKGKSIGSLSGGIADVMGRRKADEAAARKEFQTAQSLHDQELNALDTMRQLQRERDTAIAVGDVAAARALQDQITSVNRFYQKAKEDRQTAERNYQLEVLKTQATQDQARASLISAGKPSDFEQRVRLYSEKPEQYRTMYGIDPKETSVELRALKDEQQDLHKRLESAMTDSQKKPIYEALDKIAQRRRELMGAPTAAPTGNASDPLGIRK